LFDGLTEISILLETAVHIQYIYSQIVFVDYVPLSMKESEAI